MLHWKKVSDQRLTWILSTNEYFIYLEVHVLDKNVNAKRKNITTKYVIYNNMSYTFWWIMFFLINCFFFNKKNVFNILMF